MDCLFPDVIRMLLSTVLSCGLTVSAMTEPPRPPGNGIPDEPTSGSTPPPPPPYAAPEAPGYGTPPPPAGGYAPPPGYGQPPGGAPQFGAPPQYGYGAQQPGSTTDDKTWVLVAHFGGAAGAFVGGGTLGWVAPLIAMLSRGNQSPWVRAEAVKALNFQLLWSIIAVVCWVLACAVIGAFLAPIAALIAIIFGVIAGVKASNGEPYNYPMTVQIIK
jgi:uncharacterized Tic20 family protein